MGLEVKDFAHLSGSLQFLVQDSHFPRRATPSLRCVQPGASASAMPDPEVDPSPSPGGPALTAPTPGTWTPARAHLGSLHTAPPASRLLPAAAQVLTLARECPHRSAESDPGRRVFPSSPFQSPALGDASNRCWQNTRRLKEHIEVAAQ